MPAVDRRSFLRNTLKLGGGAIMAPSLAGLAACNDAPTGISGPQFAKAAPSAGLGRGGYGPLSVSADCPELLIPHGFTCVKLSTTGQPSLADSSFIVPIALDGMAAYRGRRGTVRLVRNHEGRDDADIAVPIGPMNAYDMKGTGGTSTLEVRYHRRATQIAMNGPLSSRRGIGRIGEIEVTKEFVSINGTHVNCAGGPTPWGSWLTCEETTEGPGSGRERNHGYVFDVPADSDSAVDPVPLPAMGRFVHEAVAVDPRTGIVYETEDRSYDPDDDELGSGFYRFIPYNRRDLTAGGRLQVLAVRGRPNYDTTTGQTPGSILPVSWVDIDDPDPANAEDDTWAVFRQGLDRGAAIFQRLEGCWYGDGSIFFNATSGGDAGEGHVWQYRPFGGRRQQLHGHVAGQLILVFESPGADVLESPDNITVSPRGGIVLCEDGGGEQFLRGLTRRGEIFDFVQTNGDSPEFAGACFSPDGEVLFFNIQGATRSTSDAVGFTFAMWGPWERGVL